MFKKDTLKLDIGKIYLPSVLSLTKNDLISEGVLVDVATLEETAALHPLAKC